MNVRYATSSRSPSVEIEYGLAYEFLMTLLIFSEEREKGFDYEIGSEWFEAAQAKIKTQKELLRGIKLFASHCNHSWKHLLGIVYDSEPPRDVPALLATLEAIEPLELRLHLMGYYRREFRRNTPLDVMLEAAEGDVEAQREFLKTSFPDDGDWQDMLQRLFSMEPEALKEILLRTLREWYELVFRDYEEQWLPILARDAEAKQVMKQSMPFEQLIETATNGLVYVPEPGLRRVLLLPSYIERPWNELSEYQDMKIFWYPVADESVTEDSNTPPVRLVRLYKALADERRLRILKMLMSKSYTLQELADEFGVAKTTMHHHLATLRTAGLVLAQSNDKMYSIRTHMLSEVTELLDRYLKGKAQ